jgi:hypothetical protein
VQRAIAKLLNSVGNMSLKSPQLEKPTSSRKEGARGKNTHLKSDKTLFKGKKSKVVPVLN